MKKIIQKTALIVKNLATSILIGIQKNKSMKKAFWTFLTKKLKGPSNISIELTNACNSKCIMCPRDKMTRCIKYMDWKLFTKIVDECAKLKISVIAPFMYGEPLLHPNLIKYIEYIKKKTDSIVTLNTNGQLLNEDMSKRLLNAKIDTLMISIDGATKKTYEKIRKGLSFEKVTKNLENFIRLRNRGKYNTKIELFFVKMKENEHEVKDFLKKWKHKVDFICVSNYNLYTGEVKDRRTEDQKQTRITERFPCPKLWTELTVLADGKVALCCMDFDGKVILGDANKESLLNIWKNEKYNKIRKMHIRGKFPYPCSNCNAINEIPNFNYIMVSYLPFSRRLLKIFK